MKAVYRDNKGRLHSTGERPVCVECGSIKELVFYNLEGPWCMDCWQIEKKKRREAFNKIHGSIAKVNQE